MTSQGTDITRLDEVARGPVDDEFDKAPHSAGHHGRAARHRFERAEAEQLTDSNVLAIARPVDRRHRNHGGPAIQAWKLVVGDRAEEPHILAGRQPPQMLRVVALRACSCRGRRSRQR